MLEYWVTPNFVEVILESRQEKLAALCTYLRVSDRFPIDRCKVSVNFVMWTLDQEELHAKFTRPPGDCVRPSPEGDLEAGNQMQSDFFRTGDASCSEGP